MNRIYGRDDGMNEIQDWGEGRRNDGMNGIQRKEERAYQSKT
jgi:hypothetical protein